LVKKKGGRKEAFLSKIENQKKSNFLSAEAKECQKENKELLIEERTDEKEER